MGRDRRWDYLYDVGRQPVKEYVLARFARELADELRGWPLPFDECVPGELLARHAAGLAERPRDVVVRFALRLSRLELRREFDEVDRLVQGESSLHWQSRSEAAAGHLLVRLVTERCLELMERASGLGLSRAALAGAVASAEELLSGGG